jgi:hypothetical protein
MKFEISLQVLVEVFPLEFKQYLSRGLWNAKKIPCLVLLRLDFNVDQYERNSKFPDTICRAKSPILNFT